MAMALPALGFAGTGIAANSIAASLMSWSAVANGGGVPAGGLVATLQSLGECGAGPWGRDTKARGPRDCTEPFSQANSALRGGEPYNPHHSVGKPRNRRFSNLLKFSQLVSTRARTQTQSV